MGKELPSESFINWLGEDKYKKLVKFILGYISQLDIPVMRYVARLTQWHLCRVPPRHGQCEPDWP